MEQQDQAHNSKSDKTSEHEDDDQDIPQPQPLRPIAFIRERTVLRQQQRNEAALIEAKMAFDERRQRKPDPARYWHEVDKKEAEDQVKELERGLPHYSTLQPNNEVNPAESERRQASAPASAVSEVSGKSGSRATLSRLQSFSAPRSIRSVYDTASRVLRHSAPINMNRPMDTHQDFSPQNTHEHDANAPYDATELDDAERGWPLPNDYEQRHATADAPWRTYMHAICSMLVAFNTWGLNYSFSLAVQIAYQQYLLGNSYFKITWIGSTQLALIFFTAIPAGAIYDRGCSRYLFHGGSLLLVLSHLAASWCHTWTALFQIQGLLEGLAMGMVFNTSVLSLAAQLESNIGAAMAVGAFGSSLGGILHTLLAQKVTRHANGVPWALRAQAFLVLVTMVLPNVFFRAPSRRLKAKAVELSQGPQTSRPRCRMRIPKDAPFIMMTLGMFFSWGGLYFCYYFVVPYSVMILHQGSTTSTNLLLATLAANIPGRFLPNFTATLLNAPLGTLIVFTLFSGGLMFAWIAVKTVPATYAVVCLYGFASGGTQSLFAAAVQSLHSPSATYLPSSSSSSSTTTTVGPKMGFTYGAIGLGVLVGPPITGALVGLRDQMSEGMFLYAQIFSGGTLAMGGVCFLIAKGLSSDGNEAKN